MPIARDILVEASHYNSLPSGNHFVTFPDFKNKRLDAKPAEAKLLPKSPTIFYDFGW